MDSCCENKAGELALLRERQSRVLYIVLAINAAMFLVEFAAGWLVGSTALLGDSLDMLGDASVYALTLFVLHRSVRARAGAALVKGAFMLLFGAVVIADAVRKVYVNEVPVAEWMGLIGLVALIANSVCFFLLYTHRSDDLNMRSTWLCSRNDLVANSSVIVAAGLVALTGSLWPDVIVGIAIAVLFLHSAGQVLHEAWGEWRVSEGPQGTNTTTTPQTTHSCRDRSIQEAAPMRGCCDTSAPSTADQGSCCAAPTVQPASPLLVIAEPTHSPQQKGREKPCCGPEKTC
ncbi:cation transporter [Aquipseudomonas alcaligenes]|uniref:cation transporter n=1 Tax=Aquipseudomonas alcaligenes TaxID=43263 RepID=UPI00364785EA